MITAKARPENNPRTPNNTTLHLEREDKGLKTRIYTVYTGLRIITLQLEFFYWWNFSKARSSKDI
jgi:hypothetical protein